MRTPGYVQYKSISDLLKANCKITDRGITFINNEKEERFVPYQDLFQKSVRLLYYLQQHGIEPGTEVLLQIEDNEVFLNFFWACLLGGIIPVPVTVGSNDENKLKVFRIWGKLKKPYIVTSQKWFMVLEEFAFTNHFNVEIAVMKQTVFIFDKNRETTESGIIYNSKLNDIAFIQFSSGSTGEPKGVVLTHQNLLSNINSIIFGMDLKETDSMLSWMPLTHDMGLIGLHLVPTMLSINHFLFTTSTFIRQPGLWLKKASEHKVTVLSSPNFGYKHFLNCYNPETMFTWDLSSVRFIVNGAEPISEDLIHTFLKTLESTQLKKVAMFPVYGLAEATLAVTFPPLNKEFVVIYLDRRFLSLGDRVKVINDETDPNRVSFVDEGYPLKGCQVRICDDKNEILDEYTIGHIQIKGDNVTKGYYCNEDATLKSFTKDGWFITGDLGFLQNGRLVVTGRYKDIIFVNGQNFYPQDLERITEDIDNIELGKVVTCGVFNERLQSDEIVFFVLFRKKLSEFISIVQAIKTHINRRVGLEVSKVIPVKDIPKTTSGKIQRYILKDKYLNGDFKQVVDELQTIILSKQQAANISISEIEKKLQRMWEQIFKNQDGSFPDNFSIIGNSLMLIQYHALIEQEYPGKIVISDLFTYPTVPLLAHFLSAKLNYPQSINAEPAIEKNNAIENKIDSLIKDVNCGQITVEELWKCFYEKLTIGVTPEEIAVSKYIKSKSIHEIAIIGIAMKFPMTSNSKEFWDLLSNGKDCIRELPISRKTDCDEISYILNFGKNGIQYSKGGYLEEIDQFDYDFFQLTPQEANLMDPHQRLFLETAWSTIEDAGYGGLKLKGSKTGVYIGYSSWPLYGFTILNGDLDLISNSITGNAPALIPSRVSYLLNLRGPSMVVDTACSSSLVAVHLACQAIRNHECELALAGGVKILLDPVKDLFNIGVESEDCITKTFDESSNGSGWGEGVAAILLKPLDKALEDHDQIYAVIKGSAINQDGTSAEITAPNVEAQEEVILEAWRDSGINPESLSYIEAHGTGTKFGDSIEIEAIRRAFGKHTNRKQFCAIGSVKTNLGHLESASGITSLIKAVLALKNKQIPPTNHFQQPNRNISFEDSPVFVNDRLRTWKQGDTPRRCGVSAFGISGTNCHVIVEEAPEITPLKNNPGVRILALSASSEVGLKDLVQAYQVFLKEKPTVNVDALCYTANTGRGHYSQRLLMILNDFNDLYTKISNICQTDFDSLSDPGIFYGKPISSSGRKHLPEAWEAKRSLDIKAQHILNQITTHQESSQETIYQWLQELGQLYVQGADFPWEQLYQNKTEQKISLPGYPFQYERCWFKFERSDTVTDNRKVSKPVYEVELKGKEQYSETEKRLARLWAEILGYQEINIDDNFYELGGNSLKATFLVFRINREFNVRVSVKDILNAQTIQGISEIIVKSPHHIYSSIKPVSERAYYPVSSAQKRLFILNYYEGIGTSYNIFNVLEIKGNLHKEQFENTIKRLIQRHDSLRTSFDLVAGEPVQLVHGEVDFYLNYRELARNEADSNDTISGIIQDFIRPFDLSQAPLLRAGLLKISEKRHLLLFDMHHIISDGTSMNVLIRDFAAIYSGETLPDLRIQYKDFSEWQHELFTGENIKHQEIYWLKRFAGEIPVLDLPIDYPRPAIQGFKGEVIYFTLDQRITVQLNQLAVKNRSTLYMVLLAVYTILLAKYSGQEDIVVGSPIAGRPHADLENIIGMFVNTLAMRNYPTGEKTFREFLAEVRTNALQAYENQDYPFETLVDKLELKRDLSRNPLFDVIFVLQDIRMEALAIRGLNFIDYPMKSKTAKFDVTLQALEQNGEISFSLEYCTQLFKPETIQQMAKHIVHLIKTVVNNPTIRLSEIELILEEEKQKILFDFNATKAEYPHNKTIQELFEAQVDRTPESIALIYENREMTYRELNQKANRLARLLRKKGVRAESIIGIMVERSLEMIVGIIGILKAGGAYMPIDPEYPEDRIKYMLADSGTMILLTQSHLKEKYVIEQEIIDLDNVAIYDSAKTNLQKLNQPHDLAYVIYTSGSTGKPKGVMIEHYSLVNRLHWMQKRYPINGNDTLIQKTPFVFDVSVWELLWWTSQGAKLSILKPGGEKNPQEIIAAIYENHVTTIHFVPSMLTAFLEFAEMDENIKRLGSLRQVFASGEALSAQQVSRFNRLFKGKVGFYNLYGPTEATIDVSYFDCLADQEIKTVPIGKPIDNISLYILDPSGNLCPVGIMGELCISGDGVARGYLNRPELTAEKFVKNPFKPGQRMYKTGDLARWLPDGNIEFLGRIDQQVKIRGFRIELGEIENQLLKYAGIHEAAVISGEDKTGGKYLCAYLTSEKELNVLEIREYLAKVLPDYMIPSYFVQMEQLPLTSNGKLDRKALPEPTGNIETGAEYLAPRNENETKLVEVWQEVLGLEKVGILDSFFVLGGDSIKAIQVVTNLHNQGLKLELKDLFQHQTIEELSRYLAQVIRQADQGVVEGNVELTPIQRWFYEQSFGEPYHFNQSVMLFKKEGFEEDGLRKVFNKVIAHHDALRMIYSNESDKVLQYNKAMESKLYNLTIVDFRNETGYEEKVIEIADQIQASIDLVNGPLIKLGLFKTGIGDHLLIVVHHLVIDDVSWRVILEDMASAYQQYKQGFEITLPGKTNSFKEWAKKQVEFASSKELCGEIPYWKNLEAKTIKRLPRDYEVQISLNKDIQSLTFRFTEAETMQLLKQANEAYHTEINDLLLTALGLVVKEWSGENQVLINLEGHGREAIIQDVNISRTVGWFTSAYPVILDMTHVEDLGYQIKLVKESLRRIPNKGVGYGILKYLTPKGLKESLQCNLEPEIRFNYLEPLNRDLVGGNIELSQLASGEPVSGNNKRLYTLDINGMVAGGRLSLTINYNKNEYREETIHQFITKYKHVLMKIIEHCIGRESELTPSDVGDHELSIAELKYITDLYGQTIQAVYPLSTMQSGMLFHAVLDKQSQAYFEQISFTILGTLDIDIFQKSFNTIVQRYDVLRTNFAYENLQKPRQVVLKERLIQVEYQDLKILSEEEKQSFIETYLMKDKEKGFELTRDVLMRLSILETWSNTYVVVWSIHHILMDGWCMGIIIKEFLQTYHSLKNNIPLVLEETSPYNRYITWLEKQDKEEARDYWKNYLANYGQLAGLPRTGRKQAGYLNKNVNFSLEAELTGKLKQIASNNGVTLNTVFQSIWGILLQKYNNTEDVVFGAVVSGRPSEVAGIEKMVGLFINTIPVRIHSGGQDKFYSLIKRIQRVALDSEKYSYLPLAEIQANSELKQGLIDHIIAFENYPFTKDIWEINKEEFRLQIDQMEGFEQTNYDFNIIVEIGNELTIKLSFNGLVYEEESIRRIEKHFKEIAKSVVKGNILLHEIEMISKEEKQELLYDFNNTKVPYTQEKTIHQLFEERAAQHPEHPALVFEEVQLTYGELNRKANQLARVIMTKGVRPGDNIALVTGRSPVMIIGMLAILKSGGAYVPVDPDYPKARQEYLFNNAMVTAVLTDQPYTLEHRNIIQIDDAAMSADTVENLDIKKDSHELAYVIYTSGSTGTPKGVMIEHHAAVNLIQWVNRQFQVNEKDRLLFITSMCFDLSVYDIFGTLAAGGRIVMARKEQVQNPEDLKQLLFQQRITFWDSVPSTMNYLVNILEEIDSKYRQTDLRLVFMSGDWIPVSLPERLKRHFPHAQVISLGGATEGTVWSIYYPIEKVNEYQISIPYGRPIDNNYFYILDKDRNPVPKGVSGELYIGGVGVARGYINNPERTAAAFFENPFLKGPSEMMYRTGDLGRMLPEGYIEFLGRIDHQVKIRGYRVELGEIESKLATHPAVQETVVLDKTDGDGNKFLCAYIVCKAGETITSMKEYLSTELPDYMIPSYFIRLEKLPLTQNGKLDRKALPEPAGNVITGTEYEPPRTETEFKLVRLWEDLLEVKPIGINDHFFTIGGHSLKAMALASQIHKGLNVDIPLEEIFKRPILKELAEYIERAEKNIYHGIKQATKREYYPVSPAQKRLFILEQFKGVGTSYNISGIYEVEGRLEKERLEVTFKQLIERHESLRTSFELIGKEPVQRIHPEVNFYIDYQKLDFEEADSKETINRIIKDFIQPFNLNQAPLVRVKLLKISENRHLLMFDMHHIIADGMSVPIMIRDFAVLYNGEMLKDLRIQYKDFSEWQHELFNGETIKRQEAYWLNRFIGDVPVLNLATDYPRLMVQNFTGDVIHFGIDQELASQLNQLAVQNGATLYMSLLAVYTILLAKYNGQEDIIVGTPIAGRPYADLENIIGMFVNTLAMRNQPTGEKTYQEFLAEVKDNALAAYENQDYQFEELVEKLSIRRDLSRNPLFDTMFILQNQENEAAEISGLTITPYNYENKIAKFDLTLQAVSANNEIHFQLEYCTKLFKPDTIQRMTNHIIHLIETVVKNPALRLSEIELISEEEKQQLLYQFNNTKAEYQRNKTIQELFEEQAAGTPENIALVFESQQMTYGELNQKANQLARVLRKKGVQAESIVGIIVERSLEMIIGILGILKAGGAYLPIDPEYPEERIKFMLADSKTGILLSQSHLQEKYSFEQEVIDLDNQTIYHGASSNLENINRSNHSAYVIYTSGSTGKPKGVVIEHKAIHNFIKGITDRIDFTSGKTILSVTTISFDIFVLESLLPLTKGLKIVIANRTQQTNPAALSKILSDNKVEMLQTTPSRIKLILEHSANSGNSSLLHVKELLLGGEALPESLLKELRRITKAKIYNMYGPTETTVWSTMSEMTGVQSVNIGKPIVNTQIYIVDKNNHLQPIGTIGELSIAGEGLAREYLERPELTAEKFVDNPFEPGERMYRTGDLARWLPDGNIEFFGRIDQQVKIRGFRIELGEIESKLLKCKGIQETVVIAKEDKNGNKFLCAYFVADNALTNSAIREHLSRELPDYMIPSYFVQLEKLPLTPNGKLDRKALLESEGNINTGIAYETPQTETEFELVKIWEELLEVKPIGLNDHFFAIGGHSLKAMVLASRIHKELNVEISLEEIFKKPTIKELGRSIDQAGKNIYYAIKQAEKREYYPLSSAQMRLYILDQFEGVGTSYNIPGIFELIGKIDRERLEKTLQKLILRHESFRTSFELFNGEPIQRIHEAIETELSFFKADEQELPRIITQFIRPFDLKQAPLFRVGLVTIEVEKNLLMVDMHHIISDGVSTNILLREFGELYAGRQLPELRIQYKDFSEWQNRFLQTEPGRKQEKYWLNQFAGEIPVLNLPVDYPRPPVQSFAGERIEFAAGPELTAGLKSICRETGATLFMVLLAAYNILLSKYSGQEDLVIGTPVAGRLHVDLENIVGLFVNTLAMRNRPESGKTFKEFLAEVRENALEAYKNQQYQFDELVEHLKLKRDLSRNPLFDVMFVLQNTAPITETIGDLQLKPFDLSNRTAKFDLMLSAEESRDQILFFMEYSTKLFQPETIERLNGHFLRILDQITGDVNLKLAEIKLISPAEQRHIFEEFNNTNTEYQDEKTIQELFEEQVAKTPGNIALVFEGQQMTYGELNQKANQLARVLREKGVQAESIVGIIVERSLEMIIGILGVLKAGGTYLPIDPEYPEERIKFMLADSKTGILLSQSHLQEKYSFEQEVIDLDNQTIYHGASSNLETINRSNHLAYVIYTSGSTGIPKGVAIEHKAIHNFIKGITDRIDFTGGKTILSVTTISFDIFVLESLLPLTKGLKIIIANRTQQTDPTALSKVLSDNKVEMLQTTPSRIKLIREHSANSGNSSLLHLKEMLIGGEALPESLLKELHRITKAKIYNMYGPTETTVWSTMSEMTGVTRVNIGKPIANTRIYIVDKNNHLQPIGTFGELCIAGEGLAREYLERPELTAEKFVDNPFKEGERMYRTGDLARWLPDGNIEFLGRIDHQVKIHGYRIELGEIESQLIQYEPVTEAVVTDWTDPWGTQYLCAYIVASREINTSHLQEHLKKYLPYYMIPAYFIQLEKMPLTANGKIDRKTLPNPKENYQGYNQQEYSEPEDELEMKLTTIWCKVLGIERVSTRDNFFDIGGNSVLVIKLHSCLEQEYPGELVSTDIFAYPTIAKIAEYIRKKQEQAQQLRVVVSGIPLPADYFIQYMSANKATEYKFQIDNELLEKIQNIAQEYGTKPVQILLGLYIYLFAELSGNTKIHIQTMVNHTNRVYPLSIDLDGIEEYHQLFERIDRIQQEEISWNNYYHIEEIGQIIPDKNDFSVVPFFYNREMLATSINLLELYDIIFEIDESSPSIGFKCEYNADKLHGEKIEELIHGYFKLIQLAVC